MIKKTQSWFMLGGGTTAGLHWLIYSYAAKTKRYISPTVAQSQEMNNDVSSFISVLWGERKRTELFVVWCLKSDISYLWTFLFLSVVRCSVCSCVMWDAPMWSWFVCVSPDSLFLSLRWSPWLPRGVELSRKRLPGNGQRCCTDKVFMTPSKSYIQYNIKTRSGISVFFFFFLLIRRKWIITSKSILLTSIECEHRAWEIQFTPLNTSMNDSVGPSLC